MVAHYGGKEESVVPTGNLKRCCLNWLHLSFIYSLSIFCSEGRDRVYVPSSCLFVVVVVIVVVAVVVIKCIISKLKYKL